jgi:hypothetical protein
VEAKDALKMEGAKLLGGLFVQQMIGRMIFVDLLALAGLFVDQERQFARVAGDEGAAAPVNVVGEGGFAVDVDAGGGAE